MKLGVIVPIFHATLREAEQVAQRAYDSGLEGIFAYDHLWPMGQPLRPALSPWPVLAHLGVRFAGLRVGPLVARVSLYQPEDLASRLLTLNSCVPGGVMSALGTGDRLSSDEDAAYGLALNVAERRQRLDEALTLCSGLECWVGAGASATIEIARRHGATVNLWQASAERVRVESREGPVSWAGDLDDDVSAHLDELEQAGATWVVSARARSIEQMSQWREP